MKKFIPREKMSKKERRELDLAQRQTWAINPVSRKTENAKAYDRRKARKLTEDDSSGLLYCG